MPFGIQPIHILIILVVAFLLFGTSQLPDVGRNLGKAINEFRKGAKEAAAGFKEEVKSEGDATGASAPPAQVSSPVPVSPAPGGNFCTKCGAANPPDARFCGSCGTKLIAKAV